VHRLDKATRRFYCLSALGTNATADSSAGSRSRAWCLFEHCAGLGTYQNNSEVTAGKIEALLKQVTLNCVMLASCCY